MAYGTCGCEIKQDEYLFLKLFESLEEFSQFHRNEPYFKQELETYYKAKDNPAKLKEFTIKNEQIGAEEGFFIIEVAFCQFYYYHSTKLPCCLQTGWNNTLHH